MFEPASPAPETPWRVSRADYDRMVDAGILTDQRVELLHGAVVQMSPQGVAHAFVVKQLTQLFFESLGRRAEIRSQMPLALSADSEPEPDVFLAPLADYSKQHPNTTFLIVEVAQTSMAKDKNIKADLYALAAQPEYWLVDIDNRCVLIHRAPQHGRYSDIRTAHEGEAVSPLQFPELRIAVSEILPAR
jgi:Uma2 family endonuclease